MRYLDQVREQTELFLKNKISHNYFTGDQTVPLTATLEEAEVLFAANDSIKSMASSGALKQLHDKYSSLQEESEALYINTRDKIENIIQAVQSKENEIYAGLNIPQQSLLSTFQGEQTINNLLHIEGLIKKGDASLSGAHSSLIALLGVKVRAYEQLVQLQTSYVHQVENDALSQDDLRLYTETYKTYNSHYEKNEASRSADSDLLGSQLGDVSGSITSAHNTFAKFHQVSAERLDVFKNYLSDPDQENLAKFKNELLHHLASSIVIKESRLRYQKEQFDRLLITAQSRALAKKSNSLETFCVEYVKLIEALIDQSHNYKCPKIQANYDEYGESTIRPLNSTIFHFFFSADRYKRTVAQWLLSSVRYPNEKVRRAYMRFFA